MTALLARLDAWAMRALSGDVLLTVLEHSPVHLSSDADVLRALHQRAN